MVKLTTARIAGGREVRLAEFDEPPAPSTIAALRKRGVGGVEITSRCWDPRAPSLAWLEDLQPVVVLVRARGIVPPMPAGALGHVERLDVHARTRLRQPIDVSTLTEVRELSASADQLEGTLSQMTRLRDLYLDRVAEPSMAPVSGMRELEHLRLEMRRGVSTPFDFRCDDPPPRLRELIVMDAPLGSLAGLERLAGLEILVLSPDASAPQGGPVDLRPLSRLERLQDVRIVSNAQFEHISVIEGLPRIERARIGGWCGDRPVGLGGP